MSNFKPLLAYTVEDTSKLEYPLLASVKLDGIRAVVIDGVVYSRSMKPIRSKTVQKLFGRSELNGLDGELLYGDWNAPNVFNLTTQACMSTDLKPEFDEGKITFAVFDKIDEDGPYFMRSIKAAELCHFDSQTEFVTQLKVESEKELLEFEQEALDDGYEGVMVRSLNGRYKQGRSTAKEGLIGKIKRFEDAEAVVIGFEEKMTNTNEKKTNELGYSERSTSKDGMVGANTLGALICECEGIRFTCGSGLDDSLRNEIWQNRDKYLGKLITFKHFAVGRKDSFRFPIFKGFRDVDDTSM
jgi:DNA ligase-1